MKNVAILGSTGSVGTSAVEVADRLEDTRIFALSANTEIDLLEEQILKYRPLYAAVSSAGAFDALRARIPGDCPTRVLKGMEGICRLVKIKEVDTVVNALAGIAGLRPAVEGLKSGKRMAIANKESIVMGWKVIAQALSGEAELIPVDSEHSALFQIIRGENKKDIRRLIVTASGGAVYDKSPSEMEKVDIEECLRHPTWDMGQKITVDSATLMNKGLELIEAHFLFDIPLEKIDILIHPQSIVHGMVEFTDGSMMAHLGTADMKIPIQYALTYPRRKDAPASRLRAEDLADLKFSLPDDKKFPCPGIARRAAEKGEMKNILLCAADKVAVDAFSRGDIKFTRMGEFIREVVETDMERKIDTAAGIEKAYNHALEVSARILKGGPPWKQH